MLLGSRERGCQSPIYRGSGAEAPRRMNPAPQSGVAYGQGGFAMNQAFADAI